MSLIRKILSLLVLSYSLSTAWANEGTILFYGATVIDGTGAPPLENAALVVSDGRIRAIGRREDVSVEQYDEAIDLGGKTVIPGLINAHGHVGGTYGLQTDQYNRDNLLRQLALYARYGVTTVYSLGGDGPEGFALRNEQDHAGLDRARLYVAGSVVTGNTEAEIVRQVNDNADQGADFIKVRVDDNLGRTTKMPRELFDVLLAQAHSRRSPLAVHLFYLDDARYVLEAGADLIAHSIRDLPVDDAFIELIRDKQVCYVPTLTREVSTFVYENEPGFFSHPFFRQEVQQSTIDALTEPERMERMANSSMAQGYKAGLEVAMENVGRLAAANVPIAMGTDSGPPARFQGFFEHMELSMMVEAGMSPMQAIRSATSVAADCMGNSMIGSLEPGNWADFVVLENSPLEAIDNTRSIDSVWIAGNRVPDN